MLSITVYLVLGLINCVRTKSNSRHTLTDKVCFLYTLKYLIDPLKGDNQMTQIKLTHLKKIVAGEPLFDATDLTATTGDVVGIVGNNGTGKTTLMKIIAQQDTDFEGQRIVQGTLSFVHQVNPITDKSGGQETIAKIREALALRPEILILDEPTANLDEQHQDWLVKQVNQVNGLILVISHDRHFLTQTATKIWAISNGQYTQFDGNLANFEQLTKQNHANQLHEYHRQTQKEHDLKLAVQSRKEKAARIRRGSRKMGRVELAKTKSAREQNAGKMERGAHALLSRAQNQNSVEKPFETSAIKLMVTDFPAFSGKTVVSANDLTLKPYGKALLTNGSFQIKPGERVALVGPNGIGKTTLIQAILAEQPHTHLSIHAKVGYFNQDITKLPLNQTVWEFMKRQSVLDDDRTRQMMGAFGLNSLFYTRQISELSGGERVKLQLLSVLLSESNFLILDEPTNFLDGQALDALATYLIAYPGTVLLVSHDVDFRQRVVNRTLKFQNQQLIDPQKTAVHAANPSDLPLLQLRYDQLMTAPESDSQELQRLKKQIDALK